MRTLMYLIFKRVAKRSPRNTRDAVIASFHHIDRRTVQAEIDRMLDDDLLRYVPDGKIVILRASGRARQMFPDDFARMQRELDRENQ